MDHRLPSVAVSSITGLLECLVTAEGEAHSELAEVADEMHLGLDDMLPVAEALEILRFASVSSGRFNLTEVGNAFAKASILDQKKIFARQLLDHTPLAVYVRETLEKAEAVMEHEYPVWDSIWIDPPNRRPDPDYERWLTFEQRS